MFFCASCEQEVPPDSRFCNHCGLPLEERSQATPSNGDSGTAAFFSRRISSSEAAAAVLSRGSAFVGRQREMDELKKALEEAQSSRGRVVMLVGEPGIGKTRTCQEFAEYARQRGAQALWGRCYEEQGMPPYWPWVQAIRSYVLERDAEALRSEMGAGAADIAEIVPDVKERLPDLRPAPEVDNPEQARFRLFDSITIFLKNAAQNQPLVLILDNLHGADKPSLLLLEFLAHEMGSSHLLIVGTYRDLELTRQHPLSETLGELTRERLFQRLLLHGLASGDVAAYVAEVTGTPPSPGLVGAIHTQTEGNPLFITEVVRLLAEEGQLDPDRLQQIRTLSTSIPHGVREVIGRRLNRLSEGCIQTLTIASVMGREFSLAELERLIDYISEDRLLGALEEAVAMQIIEELPQTVDRYQFTHALIRETLYDELTNSRRARWHRQIGEAMEALYREDPEPYLARLASHFFAAARSGSAAKALEYCTRAGARDVALLAYEEAVSHYEMALRALELQHPPDEEARCKLLLALGDALGRAGESSQAMETFQQAASIAKKLGLPEVLAQAAQGFEEASWRPGFYGAPAVRILEEALSVLPIGDSTLKARTLGSLTRALYFSGSLERAYTVGQRAGEMARRVGDPLLVARTLNITYYSRRRPEDLEERLAAAVETIKLSSQFAESDVLVEIYGWLLFDLMEAGDAPGFKSGLEVQQREAERLRQPFYLYVAASCRAALAIAEGRFEEGEQIAKQALLIGQRFKGHDPTGVFGLRMFTIRREQGRLSEVAPAVKMFVQQRSEAAAWRPGLALVYSELGLEAEARAEFEHLAANDFGNIPQDALWVVCIVYLAEVCAFLGDVSRADTLYRFLLRYDGHNVVVGGGVAYLGAASRYLGMLACTMSHWDKAERHFQGALEMDARMGARTWLAHTQYEYARMLLACNRRDDYQKAASLLGEALATARALGMRSLDDCTADLLRRAGSLPPKAPEYPNGLTQREVEVLRLIALGKSNHEIAEELFISLRTVANHVTNILNKTSAANRTSAAAYASRHGLAK